MKLRDVLKILDGHPKTRDQDKEAVERRLNQVERKITESRQTEAHTPGE